jgi:hypothetical protein
LSAALEPIPGALVAAEAEPVGTSAVTVSASEIASTLASGRFVRRM